MSVPNGTFAAEVTGSVLGTTDTDKDQVAITFKFTGPEGGIHHITAYRYFSERALQYTVKDLATLGWDPATNGWKVNQLAEKSEANPEGGALIGAPATIVVEDEEYKGDMKSRVKWINSPGGGGVKNRIGAEGQENLSAFTKRIQSLAKGNPVAAPVRALSPDDQPPASGDDIPF